MRIIPTRGVLRIKKGRGIDGNRLAMCMSDDDRMDCSSENPKAEPKDEKMAEMIDKLAKIKIINPKNGGKAKRDAKNKYISL